MALDQENIQQLIRHSQLRSDLKQTDEATLDARVERYLEIEHQFIIGGHHFAAASAQCIDLYRDGHFIAAVMVTHAVNEGILKLVGERNSIPTDKHSYLMEVLRSRNILSQVCLDASERIWKSYRNDIHHMNPPVAHIDFPPLAKQNIQNLAIVEKEVFAADINNGMLVPKYPQYWDIQPGGNTPIYLRCSI